MRSTPFIRFALSAACTAALIPASVVAQDVVFFDDYNAASSRYPVPQPQPQPSARRVGRSVSPTRIPAGRPIASSMTREQAAQAFNQQAAEKLEQEKSSNPFSKLSSGIKGLFSRDDSKQSNTEYPQQQQQQQQRGILQAGFGGDVSPAVAARQSVVSTARRNNGGLNLRQGDQRQGLFDMALGSDDAGPSMSTAATSQTASRGNTRKPTARSNQNESRAVANAAPRAPGQSGSSMGPSSLPQLSRSPLPTMRQAPVSGLSKPSDGVVMISDQPSEPNEPMAIASDDEPLFISDMLEDETTAATPAPLVARAPVGNTPNQSEANAAASAPQPLIIENMKVNEPVVTQAQAPAAAAPEPMAAQQAAPKQLAQSRQPKPMKQPAAKVAVLPNPVTVAEEKQAKQPSQRAAALLAEAHYLARDAASEEDLTRVVQQCRHVLAIDESTVAVQYCNELASWALNKRGELKADLGVIKEAMADFDEAVSKDAGQWRAVHNRGVLMAQAGNFSEAFDAFNKTIELNPSFAKAHSNRASLYVQAGEFETALADYKRAISLDPDLVIAHKGRGRVCHVLGHLEEALQHFEAAALLSPEDPGIATCRADLLVDMGRYAQAAAGYVRAIELDPQDPIAHRNLAWLQATCPEQSYRDGQRALANASRAIELASGEDDICLDTLAAAQAATGDFLSAVETIKQAIALAPTSDQSEYTERLKLYEQEKPFRTEPTGVRQASYANGAGPK